VYWPTEPAPTGGIPNIDKVGHFAIFALVAVTGRWAGIRLRWLAPLLVVQAIGSEIIQGTLESNGRDGSAFDAMADIIGAVVGLAGWEFVVRRRHRGSNR
jgi:VanZ family protein